MQKRCASEDSDSDSLPDPKIIFYPSPSESINPGDIVWAKFRYLYWPALVRACYPKEKKISIWYCDEPGKTFKLPSKNICSFNDKEMTKKILHDAKEAGVLKEHEGLTSHAISFLRRRANGFKDDPMKFFDQTYPFFLVEEMLKKDPNANLSDIKIPPMYISHEKKMTIRMKVNAPQKESGDSELESADSDCESKKCTNDYLSEVNLLFQKNSCSPSKEINIDAIIKYILSGKTDHYLQKIKSKKIASEYHNLFNHSIKNSGKNMNEVTFTGIINDDSILRELVFYLLPLYEKIDYALKNKCTLSRKHKTVLSSSTFSDRNLGAQYVASVFLPESIIFAISKIKNISLSEAKRLFIGQSECKTKAVESILKRVELSFQERSTDSSTFDNLEKKIIQSRKKRESLKDSADSVKKMCIDKSDMVCDEKKKLTPGLKSIKNVKVCDTAKSSKISSYDDGYEEKILDFILAGKTDDYLKRIRVKSIGSMYLNTYEQLVKSCKKKLSNLIFTGPVKDDDALRKLMLYLLTLYKDVNHSHESKHSAAKKCKNVMASHHISKENPDIYYVMYVWLPESIIFAISKIGNVILSHAERVFDEYTTAKPVSDILKYLD